MRLRKEIIVLFLSQYLCKCSSYIQPTGPIRTCNLRHINIPPSSHSQHFGKLTSSCTSLNHRPILNKKAPILMLDSPRLLSIPYERRYNEVTTLSLAGSNLSPNEGNTSTSFLQRAMDALKNFVLSLVRFLVLKPLKKIMTFWKRKNPDKSQLLENDSSEKSRDQTLSSATTMDVDISSENIESVETMDSINYMTNDVNGVVESSDKQTTVVASNTGQVEVQEETNETLVDQMPEFDRELQPQKGMETEDKQEQNLLQQNDVIPPTLTSQELLEDDVSTSSLTLKVEEEENELKAISLPKGERWAISSPDVDLSGKWKIVVSEDFKKDYDAYLKNLGQPSLVRSIAVSIVDMTTEEVIQTDNGRSLCIKGKNLRGVWDRTLVASGSDVDSEHGENDAHARIPLVTADKENVEAEAWWEQNGTVHRSWLRGIRKYGGGDFESRRYLADGGTKLICESEFHPQARDKENAVITWTFERVE